MYRAAVTTVGAAGPRAGVAGKIADWELRCELLLSRVKVSTGVRGCIERFVSRECVAAASVWSV
jgi:hypothetical protein